MLPSVVAAGDGEVAVAWYASDHDDAQSVERPWVIRGAVSRDAGRTWATSAVSDHVVEIPQCEEMFSPVLAIAPLQLLAYHRAVELGRDVDRPRNLAKSVTVE